jgi:hypothetical protein
MAIRGRDIFFGVAELRYELPSPPLPRERGAFNYCSLSLGERARVRADLAIHTRSQQRLFFNWNTLNLLKAR